MPSAGNILTADMLQPDAWVDWASEGITYSGITVGNGTETAAYAHVGAFVVCRFRLVFGSTTSFSSTPQVDLPVAPHGAYAQHDAIGVCFMYDSSVGSGTRQGGTVVHNSSNVFFCSDSAAGQTVIASVPFTWATGDILSFTAVYEAA